MTLVQQLVQHVNNASSKPLTGAYAEQRRRIAEVRESLRPGRIYNRHPRLQRQASLSLLQNLPMRDLQGMCQKLNTNIDGLMRTLEEEDVIPVLRKGAR